MDINKSITLFLTMKSFFGAEGSFAGRLRSR